MRKITYLEIVEIEELKDPKKRQELFDFKPQIEFVAKYKSFFGKIINSIFGQNAGKIPRNFLEDEYGIKIAGFGYKYFSSGRGNSIRRNLINEDIAKFLIHLCPHYLLSLSSARLIKLYKEKFVHIPKKPDGTMDFANHQWVAVDPKDISTWPKDYPTAHTQPIANKSRAKFPSMKYYDIIELWPLDGYTSDERVAVIYLLYCLLHEFGHTVWHSVWYANENIKTIIEYGGKKFSLAELCDQWMEICQDEIYPVSWYSGYYAPDILDFIREKGKMDLFLAGASEEFAECFAWFIMKKTMDPWRDIQEFSKIDLGNGVPSAKYRFMDRLWNGQEVR